MAGEEIVDIESHHQTKVVKSSQKGCLCLLAMPCRQSGNHILRVGGTDTTFPIPHPSFLPPPLPKSFPIRAAVGRRANGFPLSLSLPNLHRSCDINSANHLRSVKLRVNVRTLEPVQYQAVHIPTARPTAIRHGH